VGHPPFTACATPTEAAQPFDFAQGRLFAILKGWYRRILSLHFIPLDHAVLDKHDAVGVFGDVVLVGH